MMAITKVDTNVQLRLLNDLIFFFEGDEIEYTSDETSSDEDDIKGIS